MFKRETTISAVLVLLFSCSPIFAQITWGFTYADTAGTGFNSTTVSAGETLTDGQLRKNSLVAATTYLNTIIDGRGAINLTMNASINDSGTALRGSFRPEQFTDFGTSVGSFQNGGLYQAGRTNALPFTGPAGSGQFNFGHGWNYAGQANAASGTKYDMVTVSIHELTHGLGFLSQTDSTGSGLGANAVGSVGIYSGYDRFLQRGNGLLASSALFNTDKNSPSYGTFTGAVSTLTNNNNTSTGLFFGGPLTREVNGGLPAPLYAPTTYSSGSSTSHVNDTNAVMDPSVAANVVKRFQPYEIAMLLDIGWNTYNWNSTTGNFGDGASAIASSRWTSDSGIVNDGTNSFNLNATQGEAPILPIYGQVTANTIANFKGSGTQNYTATNDLGTIRLSRLNLNSASSNTITIAGGTLNFGQNSDGTPSVLVPKIVQQNTGAFTISSAIQTNNIATQLVNGVSYTGFTGVTVDGTGTGQVNLTGVVSGNGSLTKAGTGNFTLVLANDNTYTGATTVSTGTLQIGTGGTTGSVGTGAVTNNSAIVFNRSNAATISNDISGSGTFDKQGAGTLTLSGANSYSGGTTISNGTLLATNTTLSATGTGAVTVSSGATLGGTGTASGAVTVNSGGFIRAGLSGSTRILNTGALTENGRYIVTLFGTAATGDVSQLVTTGNLGLGSATDSVAIELSGVTVTNLRTAVGAGNTRSYTVMTYTGTRTGTFDTTDFTTAGFSSSEWVADYATSGQVRLTFTPVPEPGSILAFLALGGGAVGIWRRWRRKDEPAVAV